MTRTEFGEKLTGKYPELLRESMKGEFLEIRESTRGLSDGSLRRLWDEFADTYDRASPPRRATFVQIMKALGLKRVSATGEPCEFVCLKCDGRFGLALTTCPKCGNSDKTWRAVIGVGARRSMKLESEEDWSAMRNAHQTRAIVSSLARYGDGDK